MTKRKFYVVWNGREPGLYESWEECKNQIYGFTNAKYKSFPTHDLAIQALNSSEKNFIGKKYFEENLNSEEIKLIGKPILNSVSVDAAWNTSNGIMEYQGVETKTKKSLFRMGPFEDATNNVGEYLALVHALALLKKKGDNRPIYSDSKIAIGWVKKVKMRTKLERTEKNQELFALLDRALTWLRNNSFENKILKWETKVWGEIPADFGRK
ncbi:ribonuclease HI [Algoriphagus iocasae]|uniref:Ribonuclease H n=1 Tax=Algoriphagus iocasae TaxID=1836499 RepID=A0A841MN22_9BACT|nr:ribonuclease H family protein [Algoriphagus iocasae]MBB6328870.1 ribonuclease HI [Algoriphagus iocasae]